MRRSARCPSSLCLAKRQTPPPHSPTTTLTK